MPNISVAEILKIHGKWVESSKLVELIAAKQKISNRYAYSLIKKAGESRQILKVVLPNRNVLYGLAEFGAPDGSSAEETLRLCEYLSPCEFLPKDERIMLGFVKECPKPETEIVEYLKSKQITDLATVELLNKAVQTRRILRIEKDGAIFYRFNDFPDKVNAVLFLLDALTDTDQWIRLFIDKLRYNIITQFPKYDLKPIFQSTIVEILVIYQQFQTNYQQFLSQLLKTLGETDLQSIPKLSKLE